MYRIVVIIIILSACFGFPGQRCGSTSGLSGTGGGAGEGREFVSVLWPRRAERQALLQHEGLSTHLLAPATRPSTRCTDLLPHLGL